MNLVIGNEKYVDLLEQKRKTSDLFWALQKWDCPKYQYTAHRTSQQIKLEVSSSPRVKLAAREVCDRYGKAEDEVQKEVENILTEMCHEYHLSAIRFIGFFLTKALQKLYKGIYVNYSGILRLQTLAKEAPILLMPIHRSYADFLLLSYACFDRFMPMPVIASGQDFQGMKAIGKLLQYGGAFYIRRSFGDDLLYWAIFIEYVQSLLRGGEAPLEFFVEGTRSRTAKSLTPKLGLLQAALDLYLTAQIPDLLIIPISLTYERTLEESLYVYELLGVPKPKESTSGLLKSRKIFHENFGNVYMNIGEPISLQKFSNTICSRSLHNLQPRYMSKLFDHEHQLCRDLATCIIRCHQRNLVLSAFPVICLVVANHLYGPTMTVTLNEVISDVDWLLKLLRSTGVATTASENNTVEQVYQALDLHQNIMHLSGDTLIISQFDDGQVGSASPIRLSQAIVSKAVPFMYLYHYGNQALQLLVHYSIISVIILTAKCITISEAFFHYELLQNILTQEFVFSRTESKNDFLHAVQALYSHGLIHQQDGTFDLSKSNHHNLQCLAMFLNPFLEGYRVTCQYLLSCKPEPSGIAARDLLHQCQSSAERRLQGQAQADYRILSLDILNNCITHLVSIGAILRHKKNGKVYLIHRIAEVSRFLGEIESFLPANSLSAKPQHCERPTIDAKL